MKKDKAIIALKIFVVGIVMIAAMFLMQKAVGISITNWAVEWGVCGISRMYYTLRENDITSKSKAIKYMLNVSPQKYHLTLKEAMSIRTNSNQRHYTSLFKRRKDMLRFIKYTITLCNEHYSLYNHIGARELQR